MTKISKEEFRKSFQDFLNQCKGSLHPDLILLCTKTVIFPYRSRGSDKVEVLVPSVLFAIKNTKSNHYHTVVLSLTPDKDFKIWCADGLFTTSKNKEKYEKIYEEYLSLLKGEWKKYEIPKEYLFHDAYCSFWKGGSCKHVEYVKEILLNRKETVLQYLETVASTLGILENEEQSSQSSLEKTLLSLSFRANLIIEGEQGSGKTYTALKVSQQLIEKGEADEIVIVQGDASVEGVDLLGYWIKSGDGSLVWKDGGITEAFRKAQKKKVVLIIDEILRIRARERDLLVRALTVWGDGKYRLRTGRVVGVEEGVAKEEVLEVPRENLWVVGTTNIGAQFTVEEYDPAFAERFVILRHDTTDKELKTILSQKCEGKLVELLLKFYKTCKKLYHSGELNSFPTTRTLVRAIELAPSLTPEGVKEGLWVQRYLWVGRDTHGYPVEEQEELLRRVLDEVFGGGGETPPP